MTPGIYHPIDNEAYRSDEAVCQSLLKNFANSPAHVFHAMNQPGKDPTPEMVIGCIVESIVFKQPYEYTTSPYDDFRTKEARAWRDDQKSRGVQVVDQDTVALCKRMADSVASHPTAAKLLLKGRAQVGCFAEFSLGGSVLRKGLIDWVPDDMAVLVDLKTSGCASKSEFTRSVASFRYDVQAAYYTDLWSDLSSEKSRREFAFVIVEREEPHCTAVYVLDEESVGFGRATYVRWLQQYITCRDTLEWPGYGDAPEYISLPAWARKEA